MARRFTILSILLGLCWGGWFLLGNRIAQTVAGLVGGKITSVSKGKIQDPAHFLVGVGWELLFLLTVAFLLILGCAALWRWTKSRAIQQDWIWKSLAVFAAINLLLAAALNTLFFWGAMFTGSTTAVTTQFQFKRLLLRHSASTNHLLLLGSSQTPAELDENQINQQLGKQIWTTELHFPGSAGVDLLLTLRRLKGEPGSPLVVYLSENNFYTGLHIEAPPVFAQWQDVPLLRSIGLGKELWTEPFAYGFFGQVLPLFRAREALTHRILGIALSQTVQAAHDASLKQDLEERAGVTAKFFAMGPASELQKRAFEQFILEAAAQRRKVILLEGQLNPLLSGRLPGAMRAEMKQFLRELAGRHPHVTLIPEDKLPKHGPEDYEDLTHVTPEAQTRFTDWFIGYLKQQMVSDQPSPG